MAYKTICECEYGSLNPKICLKPDFFSGFKPEKREAIILEEANFYRELTRPYYEKLKIREEDLRCVADDGFSIKVRKYWRESTAKTRPAVLFIHGGGFITCSIETHNFVPAYLAANTDAVCFSADYRLAPEFKYPRGLEDCYQVLLWITKHADLFCVSPARLSVVGDSSGGNFAAVLAMMAKERGSVSLQKQILIYPATDFYGVCPKKSQEKYASLGSGDAEAVDYKKMYLSDVDRQSLDPMVSPLLCKNLALLPDALFIQAECDALLDDGLIYARLLRQAGNRVIVKIFKGMPHAFILRTHSETFDALNQICHFIDNSD